MGSSADKHTGTIGSDPSVNTQDIFSPGPRRGAGTNGYIVFNRREPPEPKIGIDYGSVSSNNNGVVFMPYIPHIFSETPDQW